MDIYSYLKKDHRKVSELMVQLLGLRTPANRHGLFEQIRAELLLHAETEKETFYAALEKKKETKERIEEANEEHEEIKHYLGQLAILPIESQKWLEQFGEFKHCVEHHVKEEEEIIFPKAKKILSEEDAIYLAEEMDKLKEKKLENAA